jgi:hypothetical protein
VSITLGLEETSIADTRRGRPFTLDSSDDLLELKPGKGANGQQVDRLPAT